MHTGFVSSGRARLATVEWGIEGTPLVALHPGVGDSRTWQQCAPRWAEAGYRVVSYDRRGFGETRYRDEPHDDLADLRAVTAATKSRPAVIVGNSLGGGLAVDLALAHSEDVVGLVLISPSLSGYPDDDWPLTEAESEQDQLIEQAEQSGDLDLVNRLEVRYWLDGTEQPEGRVQGPVRELMTDMNGRALHAESVGEKSQHPPAWPRLGLIAVPTLVVAGEYDLPGIGQACMRIAEAIPHARHATIDGAAHCPSMDQPQKLNQLVLGFLGSLPG